MIAHLCKKNLHRKCIVIKFIFYYHHKEKKIMLDRMEYKIQHPNTLKFNYQTEESPETDKQLQ